jgi:cbb3-type cytochrome c oxidase subunit III
MWQRQLKGRCSRRGGARPCESSAAGENGDGRSPAVHGQMRDLPHDRSLNEVQPREAYLRDRIDRGGIDMPSLTGELSPAEIEKVVAYVLAVGGRRVAEPDADAQQLTLGEQVFRENCARCHGIDGRRMTSRPVYPGTDFNLVKPSERLVMQQALRGIPEEMPAFRGRLSREQLQAVAAYVTTTAGE